MMTRTRAHLLYDDILKTLQAVADTHGLELEGRGGSFSDVEYRPRVTFRVRTGVSREQADFGRMAQWYGLTPDHYKAALPGGLTLIGFRPKARRFPVLVRRADGREMCYTRDVLKPLLAAPAVSKLVEVIP